MLQVLPEELLEFLGSEKNSMGGPGDRWAIKGEQRTPLNTSIRSWFLDLPDLRVKNCAQKSPQKPKKNTKRQKCLAYLEDPGIWMFTN